MRSVIILGSGIAGLAAALRLQQRGWAIRLIERGGCELRAGHGFILLANGLTALASLCGGEAAEVRGALLDDFELLDPAGEPLGRESLGLAMGLRHDALLAMLRSRLDPKIPIEAGVAQGFELGPDGEVAAVRLDDGTTARADLYIVADGARSRLRAQLFPQCTFSPVSVVEVVCQVHDPELVSTIGRRFVKLQDPLNPRAVGLVPCGGGDLIWFTQLEADDVPPGALSPAARHALLGRLLEGWADPVPRLLARTDFARSYLWRAADMNPLPALHHGNIVLVGDAGHPFLPFTSQGVSAALEDAVALGEALDAFRFVPGPAPLRAALARYTAERLPAVTRTLWGGRALQERFLGRAKLPAREAFAVPVCRA